MDAEEWTEDFLSQIDSSLASHFDLDDKEDFETIEISMGVFKFDKGKIKTSATGKDFKTFVAQFSDDEVAIAYYRLEFGVYVLMVWVGLKSSTSDKIALTTATPYVVTILNTFSYQFMTSKLVDVDLDRITELVSKVKGLVGLH